MEREKEQNVGVDGKTEKEEVSVRWELDQFCRFLSFFSFCFLPLKVRFFHPFFSMLFSVFRREERRDFEKHSDPKRENREPLQI